MDEGGFNYLMDRNCFLKREPDRIKVYLLMSGLYFLLFMKSVLRSWDHIVGLFVKSVLRSWDHIL